MRDTFKLILQILFLFLFVTVALAENRIKIPILTYHNFNPTVPGIMSITPKKFEMQLEWLKENGFTIIPLKTLVNYMQGKQIKLPAKPVVITADDGWESVYTYMLPLVRKYNIPVTLFIYPSTISNGKHSLSWEQIKSLQKTGLFDIQCHTYWHPNFIQEKKRLSPNEYAKLVHVQLYISKNTLEKKLDTKISYLAWPFGIYDRYLENEAERAGYTMAFSIDDRKASRSERNMSQPRYMISARYSMKTFAKLVN